MQQALIRWLGSLHCIAIRWYMVWFISTYLFLVTCTISNVNIDVQSSDIYNSNKKNI